MPGQTVCSCDLCCADLSASHHSRATLPHACPLQISGMRKYNGVDASEFVLRRTVALVGQVSSRGWGGNGGR